jgi:hypothetical protein
MTEESQQTSLNADGVFEYPSTPLAPDARLMQSSCQLRTR